MRFDPGRDLQQVVALLQEGFKDELEEHDRRWLAELTAMSGSTRALSFMLRLVPSATDSFSGFVRYSGGRLVGNVTLLRHPGETWVIANVVTAPDHRRRGVGRELVLLAIDEAARRRAQRVVLQVREGNDAAVSLYADLGFEHNGATHTLSVRSARLISDPSRSPDVNAPMRLSDWRSSDDGAVRRLLARAGILDAAGPIGLVRRELNRRGLRHRLDDWLKMKRTVRVLISDGHDLRAAAVAHVTERDAAHRVDFVLDPAHRGVAALAIVDAIAERLRDEPDRAIDALVEADQPELKERLETIGFTRTRTLQRMVLDRVGLTGAR